MHNNKLFLGSEKITRKTTTNCRVKDYPIMAIETKRKAMIGTISCSGGDAGVKLGPITIQATLEKKESSILF
ncbi:hypothetical protein [Candidatus Ichthyocystis sparus]|uniref:hypothetical protein n=1 Tax=Candidatus Ichthyocystis sparus TaxID=1561004 RepID=UPI0011474921|nr:hypothetical protein [Candidatus Ichthyocystis sparus]